MRQFFSATIWISFLEEMFDMKNFARLTWPGRETPFDSAQTSKTRGKSQQRLFWKTELKCMR